MLKRVRPENRHAIHVSPFPRFSPENIAANTPIVDLLRGMAEKKNATAAQISLAWLLAQNP
jgi:aryl-alcohol dehydrogenase-like predicted oxidoreductase